MFPSSEINQSQTVPNAQVEPSPGGHQWPDANQGLAHVILAQASVYESFCDLEYWWTGKGGM